MKCRHCHSRLSRGALLCKVCGTYQRGLRKSLKYFSVLGACATAITVIFIGIQSKVIRDKFELENRPYFYVVLHPRADMVAGDPRDPKTLLTGATISYGNAGNYPVRDIKIEEAFYSDKGPETGNIEKYWLDTFGATQKRNSVPPKSVIPTRDYRANLGTFGQGQKRYIQVSIRAKYRGHDKKEYGYGLDYTYIVNGLDKNGDPILLSLEPMEYFDEADEKIPDIINLLDKYKHKTGDHNS